MRKMVVDVQDSGLYSRWRFIFNMKVLIQNGSLCSIRRFIFKKTVYIQDGGLHSRWRFLFNMAVNDKNNGLYSRRRFIPIKNDDLYSMRLQILKMGVYILNVYTEERTLIASSMGIGATFSPPPVTIISLLLPPTIKKFYRREIIFNIFTISGCARSSC